MIAMIDARGCALERFDRRRQPTRTPLYPVVQHYLETFLSEARSEDEYGSGVPDWVEEDFRAYLRCGILAHGFARVRCDGCATERLVAFSCKGRGSRGCARRTSDRTSVAAPAEAVAGRSGRAP